MNIRSKKSTSHVDSVCSTLSSGIYILRQLAKCFPNQVLMTACYGIFYPHLSYGVPLRGGYKSDLTFHPSKRSVRKVSDLQWIWFPNYSRTWQQTTQCPSKLPSADWHWVINHSLFRTAQGSSLGNTCKLLAQLHNLSLHVINETITHNAEPVACSLLYKWKCLDIQTLLLIWKRSPCSKTNHMGSLVGGGGGAVQCRGGRPLP